MKRNELIINLVNAGCCLQRHEKKYDIYVKPQMVRKPQYLGIQKLETAFVT
jgi:hypothetical protein